MYVCQCCHASGGHGGNAERLGTHRGGATPRYEWNAFAEHALHTRRLAEIFIAFRTGIGRPRYAIVENHSSCSRPRLALFLPPFPSVFAVSFFTFFRSSSVSFGVRTLLFAPTGIRAVAFEVADRGTTPMAAFDGRKRFVEVSCADGSVSRVWVGDRRVQ